MSIYILISFIKTIELEAATKPEEEPAPENTAFPEVDPEQGREK